MSNRHEKRPRVYADHDPITMTKQSHSEECDINCIMSRYSRTGLLDHVRETPGDFCDVESLDYHTACNIVADANSAFAQLPAALRAKFHHRPENYLDFVQDPKNIPEMVELGMLIPQKSTEIPASPVPPGAPIVPIPAATPKPAI